MQAVETMQIEVQLFARARELAGAERVRVILDAGATVRDLRQALQKEHPQLARVMGSLLVAVDHEYATDSTILTANSDVACFPPVSGG